MLAFLVTCGLVAYFSIVGVAALAIFPPRIRAVQALLISPTVGLACVVVPVFLINRAGVPVKEFGLIFSVGLLLLAVAAIFVRRPVLPLGKCAPYAVILLIGLVLAARPMFSFGFDWISFANDDMANYSLGAQRFYENGFFAEPDLEAFFQGKDYSQAFWFLHVMNKTRSGSELLLANVWATTGLNPHQAFMPVIFALHAALVLASAALVTGPGFPKKAGHLTAMLVAVSPMTTLGALYQLIAQVGGLALLCTAIVLLFHPRTQIRPIELVKRSLVVTLVSGCLFIYYPEVLPFLGAGWLLYAIWLMYSHGLAGPKNMLITACFVAIALAVFLNNYVHDSILFLLNQTATGVKKANSIEVLFPYFLIPSGLPVAFGLMPLANGFPEPYQSLLILLSMVVSALLFLSLWKQFRASPTAVTAIAAVMILVGLLLFFRNNDFGLFKLVMFAQPFVIGLLCTRSLSFRASSVARLSRVLIVAYLLCAVVVQAVYVEKSSGEFLGSLAELPSASERAVVRDFRDHFGAEKIDDASLERLGTSHIVMAKLQALYMRGVKVLFPSRQYFENIIPEDESKLISVDPINLAYVTKFKAEKKKYVADVYIPTQDGNNQIEQPLNIGKDTPGWDLIPGYLDVFNRYDAKINPKVNFKLQDQTESSLIFVHSRLGQHYYLGEAGNISFYPLENDPMFVGRQFTGLGRYFVFQANTFKPEPRLVIELTSTLTKQFDSALPNAYIQGQPAGFVGRGSGRVFSPPLTPYVRNGRNYIAVDMGRAAAPMNDTKQGLMLAYGRDIRLDRRLLTTFGRDISLVSQDRYEHLDPPIAIEKFPESLRDSNLEYSGIYEDGWISERSFFVLSSSSASKSLLLKGSIPLIDDPKFGTNLKLKIDGKEIASKSLGLGNFEINIPVLEIQGKHRIDVAFDRYQRLPGADGRIFGGKLDFLGFK